MRILSLIIILSSTISFSQDKDAMLWTGAGIRAKLVKRLYANYETQTRFYKNVTSLSQYYNEAGLKYEPLKGMSVSFAYRYSRKNREGYYTGENRVSLGVAYSYKVDPLSIRIKARAKYQNSFTRLGVINNVIYPDFKNMFRMKFDIKYKNDNFKRIQPFISYEFYHALQPINEISKIDSYRFSCGIDLDLPSKNEVSIFYIYETENRSVINQNHIYGIQYTYSLGKLVDNGDNSRY